MQNPRLIIISAVTIICLIFFHLESYFDKEQTLVPCENLAFWPGKFKFCKQRLRLIKASPVQISLTFGISLKKALEISYFAKSQDKFAMKDLLQLKGIGPKKLARLKKYFH